METAAEVPATPDAAAPAEPATAPPAAPVAAEPAVAAPLPTLAPPPDSGFAQMHLKVGDPMHLELQSRLVKGRATVTVLGWLENHCMLVTAPHEDSFRLALKEGETVVLRLFTGQSAFAFSSLVQKVVNSPFRYLHVSFPEKIERASVRSSPRCVVNLPATITAGDGPAVAATILNIGTTGALIETAATFEKDGNPLVVGLAFQLHGVPVSLTLKALVSGTKSTPPADSTHHQYGMRFDDLEPQARLVLSSVLYYQMLEHPRSVI